MKTTSIFITGPIRDKIVSESKQNAFPLSNNSRNATSIQKENKYESIKIDEIFFEIQFGVD